ncbi:MAG: hypothetical protein EBS73_01280 [Betaproteobacteria bacterium]|nr:hypothetical protein [Betaproteobacteria bacterium]
MVDARAFDLSLEVLGRTTGGVGHAAFDKAHTTPARKRRSATLIAEAVRSASTIEDVLIQ